MLSLLLYWSIAQVSQSVRLVTSYRVQYQISKHREESKKINANKGDY